MAGESVSQSQHRVVLSGSQLQCVVCNNELADPMLLQCLHSCCRTCVLESEGDPRSRRVTCQICNSITDTSTMDENLFIANQIALRDSDRCAICRRDMQIQIEEGSTKWCTSDKKFLCKDCSTKSYHTDEDHFCLNPGCCQGLLELCHFPPRACSSHGKIIENMCFNCDHPICSDCLKDCVRNEHETVKLKNAEGTARLKQIKEEIKSVLTALSGSSEVINSRLGHVEALRKACQSDLEKIRSAKKCLMDAIVNASDNAEEALKEKYDILGKKAVNIVSSTEQFKHSTCDAVQYSNAVLGSCDSIGLVSQQTKLLQQLRELLNHRVSMKMPLDASKCVDVNIHMPSDLQQTIGAWIGPPKLLSEDLFAETKDGDHPETLAADSRCQLKFDSSADKFQSTTSCHNIAVTQRGSLLLAALENGLIENDFSGNQVSRWIPKPTADKPKIERVIAVNAIDRDRVVIGMKDSNDLVLLQRSMTGNQWAEESRIHSLKSPPKQLAVYADLVTVGECKWNDFGKQWDPGPQLVLMKLCCGKELFRQKLDYDIRCVSLTAQSVVAASFLTVMINDTRSQYVVDCFDHRGGRLWRREFSEKVWDICAVPSAKTLYLALESIHTVKIISEDDGSQLLDAVSDRSHGLKDPARLSVMGGPETLLAVLSSDWKTISVYRQTIPE